MPGENQSSILDDDTSALVSEVLAVAEGSVFAVVAFDESTFDTLHVDDATENFYGTEEEMEAHYEQVHSYVHLDFLEMELFTDELFPIADRVNYIVTSMDFIKLIRVYDGERGIFLSVSPNEPVEPIVDVIEARLANE